jgi:hypothetical protein
VELALPVIITGIDALGRPFQERTCTAIINCHGCCYEAERLVRRGAWVNLEVPQDDKRRKSRAIRARIVSVHSHGLGSYTFGVELETAGNLWKIALPPGDWFPFPEPKDSPAEFPATTGPESRDVRALPVPSEKLTYVREIASSMKLQPVTAETGVAEDRRRERRTRVSRPVLARPSDPQYKEELETTINASRDGLYFKTHAKHYYVGMKLGVTIGYAPHDPCNASSFGNVVRIDRLNDGSLGVAVRILLR